MRHRVTVKVADSFLMPGIADFLMVNEPCAPGETNSPCLPRAPLPYPAIMTFCNVALDRRPISSPSFFAMMLSPFDKLLVIFKPVISRPEILRLSKQISTAARQSHSWSKPPLDLISQSSTRVVPLKLLSMPLSLFSVGKVVLIRIAEPWEISVSKQSFISLLSPP